MATHLSLKVKLDEDIRRFSVSQDIAFVELHHLISKHFALAPENVQLKYIDDEEELITLGSDLELQEAKRLQPTVLRLNAYDIKPKRNSATSDKTKLDAVFVRDVTVPDSTSVTAGVTFSKVWCVRNSGTEAWPEGVVLKMVDPKDDQLQVLAVGTISRPVAPGEETEIGVELKAPARSGRCVQYWRLFTEDGEAFGRRLWLDISVNLRQREAEEEARRIREDEEEKAKQQLEVDMLRRKEEEEEEERRLEAVRRFQEAAERERIEQERRLVEEKERALEEQRKHEEEKLVAEQQRRDEEKARLREEEAAALRLKQEEERRRMQSKYPAQLTSLAEMGFTNLEHNVRLLDQHKGSLDLVLESLLSGN